MVEGFAKLVVLKILKNKWAGIICFSFVTLLTVSEIVLIDIRGFSGMEMGWCFSIGANVIALAVCNMLTLSWILAKPPEDSISRIFVLLLTATASMLYLDTMAWVVQGIPSMAGLNRVVNSFYYANNDLLIYLFWTYASTVLKPQHSFLKVLNTIINLLFIPAVIVDLLNIAFPVYFAVDDLGVYARSGTWIFSQIFFALVFSVFLISLFLSKESVKIKFIIGSFATIPLISVIATRYQFGVTTQYASMLVSIVLIYCVLFAETEKGFVETSKELNTASEIQQAVLRKDFELRNEVEIYASMIPAMDVGGDFYDFFMIDDHRLALIVADVSGKGISASLFMMSSKIMINDASFINSTPSEILKFVNDHLCENNSTEMFVTVWLGILDINTGELTAANAGHENPVIKHADGEFELIENRHGFVLGAVEDIEYTDFNFQLEKGDIVYLYTDGVTETENIKHKLFKTDRMLDALNSCEGTAPKDLCENVMYNIEKFRGNAEQSDDITMLCIRYDGPESKIEKFVFEADVKNTALLIDSINRFMHSNAVPEYIYRNIDIVSEEIFVNIASYAYEEGGEAEITVESDDKHITLTFRDSGIPYNPLEKKDPDLSLSAEERPIGGLGIFMVKKMMDDVKYENVDGYNVLAMTKFYKTHS